MSQPFIGEIRMFGGNFPPLGWEFCEGQEIPIAENDPLWILIGTTYGGDGVTTFRLPDLRGRIPVHAGNGFVLGESPGTEQVTLTVNQLPPHSHPLSVSTTTATATTLAGNVAAQSQVAGVQVFFPSAPNQVLAASSVTPVGGSQPHNNMMPYLSISFIIATSGVFPTQD